MTEKTYMDPEENRSKETGKGHDAHRKKSKGHAPDKDDKKKHRHSENAHEYQVKIDELNDKYLRLYSEFDNFRRRTLKEKVELTKTASEEVIVSLLPVLDDMERAIKAGLEAGDPGQLVEGNRLIYNKFKSILEQRGLKEINALGEPFDVDYHDAITNIPAPTEDLKGRCIDQVEKGYTLNGKVIRYAKVIVGV